MSRTTSIVLGSHFNGFVENQLRHGRYASASEVIRAGLRLLEEREAHLEALRTALGDGERSGEPEPFDFDTFLDEVRDPSRT
ncbi:type II toxin-antitoxin system ParD family antitoxin [Marinivivus vitaminiproducens]|uniref:type II toxin-antitoxin system ParD family antitoxin n=1 Tax=Marinivivus vitaminiproducens TaxID=3035935 RepID=UPI0027A18EC0|nr:type II toxin-antitoxin system ParD family antitoxin [Geminicoccaceae bacterium SCSIO 64248]